MTIEPGTAVLIRNSYDEWIEAIATSGVEGMWQRGKKIHDFPVIWVKVTTKGEAIPWPLEDVREAVTGPRTWPAAASPTAIAEDIAGTVLQLGDRVRFFLGYDMGRQEGTVTGIGEDGLVTVEVLREEAPAMQVTATSGFFGRIPVSPAIPPYPLPDLPAHLVDPPPLTDPALIGTVHDPRAT